MLRLLLGILSIFSAQAFSAKDAAEVPEWGVKAAHWGLNFYVDCTYGDLKQIQNHYRANPPMQVKNTEKQWSVDHAFRFFVKKFRHFEDASIRARPKGFDFKGRLDGVHYKAKCTHKCHVHRSGQLSSAVANSDDGLTDEELLKYERDKKINLYGGEVISPKTGSQLNCMRVIISEDCEYHELLPIDNEFLCDEAVNAAIYEASENGIEIPLVKTASTLEGASSPDCSTNGHVIVFNERKENIYVIADGTRQTPLGTITNWKKVDPQDHPGAIPAPGDTSCSKHEPCICQFNTTKHALSNHTGDKLLCKDVHSDYLQNHPMLRHHMLRQHVIAAPPMLRHTLEDEQPNWGCPPEDTIIPVQYACDTGICTSSTPMDKIKVGELVGTAEGTFKPLLGHYHPYIDESCVYNKYRI